MEKFDPPELLGSCGTYDTTGVPKSKPQFIPRLHLRGGRGAYDTTGVPKSKPPPKTRENGKSKQQERWEEMNRREKMDRKFESAAPQTDREVEDFNRDKSEEDQRRLQWDQDWKSQSKATTSANSTDAPSAALSTLKISEEPAALEASANRSSKSRGGLAKVQEFATKPWTKAAEALGIGGHKEGEEKNEKKDKKKKKRKKPKRKGKGKEK